MTIRSSTIEDLPSALGGDLARRLRDSRLAALLDYDPTLAAIVDRPHNRAGRPIGAT